MEKDTQKTIKNHSAHPNQETGLGEKNISNPKSQLPVLTGPLLTLSTIILFALGEGYREGYLSGFSLDVSQMPISFHETLYWGYLANFERVVLMLFVLSVILITSGTLLTLAEWWLNKLRRDAGKIGLAKESTQPKKQPPLGLIVIFVGSVTLFSLYILGLGYLIAIYATDHGRSQADTIMAAFRANEIEAAKTYKLQCVHMNWGTQEGGKTREMYVYQLLCNDKLCKVFEPTTKTFPTVFLEGIRSIVPRKLATDGMSCSAAAQW